MTGQQHGVRPQNGGLFHRGAEARALSPHSRRVTDDTCRTSVNLGNMRNEKTRCKRPPRSVWCHLCEMSHSDNRRDRKETNGWAEGLSLMMALGFLFKIVETALGVRRLYDTADYLNPLN